MNGAMGKLYTFCNWVMLFAYVNFLWIVFTCLGLVIFGIMPATTGLFAVMRKWVGGNPEIPVFHTFWKSYKSEFFLSNKIGVLLFLIGFVLFFYFRLFQGENPILSLLIIALFVYYFIMAIYIFPVVVHYELKTLGYFRNALIISLTSPWPTIMILLWGGTSYFIFTFFPSLILFFGASTLAFVAMYFSNRAFNSIEEKYT